MKAATDHLRGDVAVKGGITTCVKAAHLAEAFRMGFEIHHGGNSLNNVANLHVSMPIRNTSRFEVPLPDAARKHGRVRDTAPDAKGWSTLPKSRASATRSTRSRSRGSGSRCWNRGQGRRQPTGLGSGFRTVPPHSCNISPPATVSGAPTGSCTSTSGRSRRIRSSTVSAP